MELYFLHLLCKLVNLRFTEWTKVGRLISLFLVLLHLDKSGLMLSQLVFEYLIDHLVLWNLIYIIRHQMLKVLLRDFDFEQTWVKLFLDENFVRLVVGKLGRASILVQGRLSFVELSCALYVALRHAASEIDVTFAVIWLPYRRVTSFFGFVLFRLSFGPLGNVHSV